MKRKIKTIISFILILAILFNIVPVQAKETGEAALKLQSEQITVMVGDSFDMPVYIENNPGIMGFDIIVEYDKTYIEPVGISVGNVLGDEVLYDSIDTSTANSFHVIWAGTDNIIGDGELFTIKFNLKRYSENGSTNVSLHINSENTYNESYDDVIIQPTSLTVYTSTDAVIKKQLNLVVYIEDWTVGEPASTPVLSGNVENGAVTYEYSASLNGKYSTDIPTQVGTYYLKAHVAETAHYQAGVATCTFRILEKTTKNPTVTGNSQSRPAKVKILKAKNKKKRTVSLKWKKANKATAYQYQYATNKKFKKKKSRVTKKTNITIKSLRKKRTYYFRVRAYRVNNGERVYGKWSKIRKVKVRK